jgi:hypothetical protein
MESRDPSGPQVDLLQDHRLLWSDEDPGRPISIICWPFVFILISALIANAFRPTIADLIETTGFPRAT